METSLVAPVSGRVREVLVSANVQVPGGRPLVQIDPLDDSPAAVEGERVTFDAGDPEPGGGPSGLERLRRLALGYDVTPAEAKRVVGEVLDAPADIEQGGAGCSRSTPTCARSTARTPSASSGAEALSSPQEHLHAFLRSLDAEAEGLPDRFVAQLERALGHFGVSGLERTAALEDAAYRLFLAQQRAGTARDAVRALLARRLEQGEALERRGRRRVPRRARPPRGRARPARARAGRAGARAALALARPPGRRGRARGDLRRDARAPGRARRAAATTATARRTCRRWSTARSRSRGCSTQGTDDFLLEALTRRYYRIRALEGLERREVDGVPFLLASYEHDGRRHHVAAAFAEPDRLPAALAALASHARTLPEGEPLLGDLYGTSAPSDLSTRSWPAPTCRPPWRGSRSSRPSGAVTRSQVTSFTRGDDGELAEDRDLRGLHPMMAQRMDLWRLENFALERLPSAARRLPVPRAGARQRARRAPRRGRRGARPHPGARRRRPRSSALPDLERIARQAFEAMRADQSRRGRRAPPAVEPPDALRVARRGVRARRGARGHHARSARMSGRARARDGPAARRRPRPALLQPGRAAASSSRSATRRREPLQPLDEGAQRIVSARRRGMVHPAEIIKILAPQSRAARRADPARRVHRVRPRRRLGRLVPVDRPVATNTASIVVGRDHATAPSATRRGCSAWSCSATRPAASARWPSPSAGA